MPRRMKVKAVGFPLWQKQHLGHQLDQQELDGWFLLDLRCDVPHESPKLPRKFWTMLGDLLPLCIANEMKSNRLKVAVMLCLSWTRRSLDIRRISSNGSYFHWNEDQDELGSRPIGGDHLQDAVQFARRAADQKCNLPDAHH